MIVVQKIYAIRSVFSQHTLLQVLVVERVGDLRDRHTTARRVITKRERE